LLDANITKTECVKP